MDKKLFETILNDLCEDWIIDSLDPETQRGRPIKGEHETNPTGYPIVRKYKPVESTCQLCDQKVEDQRLEHFYKDCKWEHKCKICNLKISDINLDKIIQH